MSDGNACICTGCRLVLEDEGRSLWGDLHMAGGASFVFNGIVHPDHGAANWEYEGQSHPSERQIYLPPEAKYFERRGVVVFDPLLAKLNPALQAHIREGLKYHDNEASIAFLRSSRR